VLYYAAIAGSVTKESLYFLRTNTGLQLGAEDSLGKTALRYAREEAAKGRSERIWDADRWARSKDVLEQQYKPPTSDDHE
jgi:hypothetical protein